MYGGPDNDWISTGGGHDTLWGGTGGDTLRSDGGNDLLYGEADNDDLRGATGNDTLSGGIGYDRLTPGTGNDLLLGGGDDDFYIFADPDAVTAETDTIQEGATEGTDMLDFLSLTTSVSLGVKTTGGYTIGTSTRRTIVENTTLRNVENVRMPLFAHTGTNTFVGNDKTTKAIGGGAADALDCRKTATVLLGVQIEGGEGNDTLQGCQGPDTIAGNKGYDVISGYGGEDLLLGHGDPDTIRGAGGNDTIYGGANNDYLEGQADTDIIYSLGGNDTLDGGTGADRLFGDVGNESFLALDAELDTIRSGGGTDSFTKDATDVMSASGAINTYYISTAGNDTLSGTAGAPWKTPSYALARMLPGDTLKVRGIYANVSPLVISIPNITITSWDATPAQIQLSFTHVDHGDGDGIWESNGNNDPKDMEDWSGSTIEIGANAINVTLDNLEITGGYYALKTNNLWDEYTHTTITAATGLTLNKSKLHGSAFDLVKLTPGCDGAQIVDNTIYASGIAIPTWFARDDKNAEGIDGMNADDATVRDNEIHTIATNGIYFKAGSRNTVIERNYLHGIGFSGIVLGQKGDLEFFDPADQLVDGRYYENIGGTVRNNVVADTDGAGLMAWSAKDASFLNNTLMNVARVERAGIQLVAEEHYLEGTNPPSRPIPVSCPNSNVSFRNNIVSVPASRPVIWIGSGGLLGTEFPTVSNNRYFSPNHSTPFWDERSGTVIVRSYTTWASVSADTLSTVGDPLLTSTGRLTHRACAETLV